jgi:Mn2+/Fe2+ NRAMP family transporter
MSDTGTMSNRSRGLRETAVSALAKVGLVWAVAVLGALFMAMSAQGHHRDGGYSVKAADADAHQSFAMSSASVPHLAGLFFALVILAAGLMVLIVGAGRGNRELRIAEPEPSDPTADLSLALGLGLLT